MKCSSVQLKSQQEYLCEAGLQPPQEPFSSLWDGGNCPGLLGRLSQLSGRLGGEKEGAAFLL